ncbi:MAG: VanZ family protein [Planctomycetota bacterium]
MVSVLSRWPATAVVAALIALITHLPPPALPPAPLFPHADKLVHFLAYLLLGALLFRSVSHKVADNPWLAVIMAAGAGIVFGVLDEWSQRFTGRTPDAADFLVDVLGLGCGAAGVLLVRRWRRRNGD